MTNSCFYHPAEPATASCVQCGMPICEQCRETVADKTVCKQCVGKMRARVEQELAANPAASTLLPYAGQPPPAAPGVWPPPPMAVAASSVALPPAAPGVGRILAGVGLSVVLGLIGTALWVAITLAMHFELSLVAIGVGWLCGWGALKGCGQGGKAPAIIGAVAALGTTLIGASILGGGRPGIFEWFCVAVGAYEGYIVPTRAARRR